MNFQHVQQPSQNVDCVKRSYLQRESFISILTYKRLIQSPLNLPSNALIQASVLECIRQDMHWVLISNNVLVAPQTVQNCNLLFKAEPT